MTLPTVIMGILISSLYGALFHLIRGGDGGKLFLYLILSWIGFWLGNLVGNTYSITYVSLGSLRLGSATVGSVIVLGIGYWLSLIESSETD